MSNNIKNVAFFVLCFSFGLALFYSISENISIQRDPATINGKIFQITNLSSEQIHSQLQKTIKVTPTIDGKKTISFSGFSSALCKAYPFIVVEFLADGVAVAGEAPAMKITTPCESGQDPAEIKEVNLPIAKILKEKPRNAEFSYDGFNAVVSFTHSADEWPRQWVLKRVEFKGAEGADKAADFGRSPASVEQPIVLEF
ncbi:MAG: hypothetical protein ABL930_09250 [Pseudobdellovibrio sp.]